MLYFICNYQIWNWKIAREIKVKLNCELKLIFRCWVERNRKLGEEEKIVQEQIVGS